MAFRHVGNLSTSVVIVRSDLRGWENSAELEMSESLFDQNTERSTRSPLKFRRRQICTYARPLNSFIRIRRVAGSHGWHLRNPATKQSVINDAIAFDVIVVDVFA